MERYCLLTDLDQNDEYESLLKLLENEGIYNNCDLDKRISESINIIEEPFTGDLRYKMYIDGGLTILDCFKDLSDSFDKDIMFSVLYHENQKSYVKLFIHNDTDPDENNNKNSDKKSVKEEDKKLEENNKDYYRLARESRNYIAAHNDSIPYKIEIIKEKEDKYNRVINIAPNITRWLLLDKQFRALYKTDNKNFSKYKSHALRNIFMNLESFKFLNFDQDDFYIINHILPIKLAYNIYMLLQDIYSSSNVLFDNQLNEKFIKLILNLPSRRMQQLIIDSISFYISDDNDIFIRNTLSQKYNKFKQIVEDLNFINDNGLACICVKEGKALSYPFKQGLKINDIYKDIARKKLCLKWKECGFNWENVLKDYQNSLKKSSVECWKTDSNWCLKADQLYNEPIWSFILKTIISESISLKSL